MTDTPTRVFKLAVAAELEGFAKEGRVCSSLDKADGFIHLSDRTSPPTVAKLFFTTAEDLHLLEIDVAKLEGEVAWAVGKMGDAHPAGHDDLGDAKTLIHYLLPDGCVHVYGAKGVPMSAVVRQEAVPLVDGVHKFPEWM